MNATIFLPPRTEMFWTPPQAARLFGLTPPSVEDYIRDGMVPISRGAKNQRRLDVRGLLAVGLIATLRRQRASLPTIQNLTEFICRTATQEILDAFSRGETILAGAGEIMPARLCRPDEAVFNRSGFEVMLCAVDLLTCYRMILARIGADGATGSSETTE
jgi:hypothetical protein